MGIFAWMGAGKAEKEQRDAEEKQREAQEKAAREQREREAKEKAEREQRETKEKAERALKAILLVFVTVVLLGFLGWLCWAVALTVCLLLMIALHAAGMPVLEMSANIMGTLEEQVVGQVKKHRKLILTLLGCLPIFLMVISISLALHYSQTECNPSWWDSLWTYGSPVCELVQFVDDKFTQWLGILCTTGAFMIASFFSTRRWPGSLVSQDQETDRMTCVACGGAVEGCPVSQNGIFPLHFGCIDPNLPWEHAPQDGPAQDSSKELVGQGDAVELSSNASCTVSSPSRRRAESPRQSSPRG